MNWFRKLRRSRMKNQLDERAYQGAMTAYLPAFLDRYPRFDLHRAERAAFMRGFVREQKIIRKFA